MGITCKRPTVKELEKQMKELEERLSWIERRVEGIEKALQDTIRFGEVVVSVRPDKHSSVKPKYNR